jgi:dipeptidyl-peptidase-4
MPTRLCTAQEDPMRRALPVLVLAAAPVLGGDQPLTLERAFGEPPLDGTLPRELRWLPSGAQFSFVERIGVGKEAHTVLWVEDAATGKREQVATDANLGVFGEGEDAVKPTLNGYQWSPAGDALLLQGGGELFLLERASKRVRRLTSTAAEEELATFSPDGRRIAFVRANDLFVLDLASGKETKISTGGSPDRYNGKLDWVYTEEISERSALGYTWSPDSRSLAYISLDEAKVPHFPQVNLMQIHPTVEEQRYPRAGDPNPVASLSVVEIPPGAQTIVKQQGVTWNGPKAEYLARFGWLPSGKAVWFELLNRDQTRLELSKLDLASNAVTTLLTDEDPAWVNLHNDLHFLADGTLVWSSEKSGFRHLYVHGPDGKPLRQLTSGAWEVTSVQRVDEPRRLVYFTATEANVLEHHLYRVKLDGTGFSRLTKAPGSHRCEVSPGGAFVLDTHSSTAKPPVIDLLDGAGLAVRTVAANEHPEIEKYTFSLPELVTVPGAGNIALNASLLKPADFDPRRHYPVIVYVYGGPHSQIVQNAWGGRYMLFGQVLASRGFVVFSLDNRGSAGRGREFERAVLRRLGKIELEDQIAGVEWLKRQPWADGERIGIWGGSYGGFMTIYALTNAPDVFKAGAAVAAVTDWRLYDSVYTERYLKLPADNPDGYRDSSPVNQADKLKGGLLLIHGTLDDNVNWHNTLMLTDKLVRVGKTYELQLYANATHRSYRREQRLDEMRRILDFFERVLKP